VPKVEHGQLTACDAGLSGDTLLTLVNGLSSSSARAATARLGSKTPSSALAIALMTAFRSFLSSMIRTCAFRTAQISISARGKPSLSTRVLATGRR
jgi:hypothetical protein